MKNAITRLPTLALLPLLSACAPTGGSGLELDVIYHDPSRHLVVSMSREVEAGESLHIRLRQGSIGELDCARDAGALRRIEDRRIPRSRPTYEGPPVDASMLESQYDTTWLEAPEPTAEMLAAIAGGQWMVDVCLMNGGSVVREVEMDLRRALDRRGSNGKFDGEEARVASTTAYAELCVEQLGEIPFFESVGDGDYGTYNCLDSTAIPTTVTDADGNVEYPNVQVSQCDNPQYIYSLCEPNAVDGRTNGPRVASRRNDQGTHWVLLCRKAQEAEGQYNDIAMIGHNPLTGRTCFFQNALYSRTDGLHVPHPGDTVQSEQSPQQSASLWDGIHGGLGSGIQCAECHDADPFVHTPWIDGAVNEDRTPVIPRIGDHPDYPVGYNAAPYYIVNTEGQGWQMPKHLVSAQADACTECHRIGDHRWTRSWIRRLRGTDTAWTNITTESYRTFERTFWMPPDLEGLTEHNFADSEYGKAMEFIEQCGRDPSACEWAELPRGGGDGGELPEVDLEGDALARAALIALGATIEDESCPDGQCATRRCAECHSVSRSGLQRWHDDTERAWRDCNLDKDPADMTEEEARRAVDCMRVAPEDPQSVFAAERLGILVTGVQYSYFRRLFEKAYGEAEYLAQYTGFKARVGMPKGNYAELSPLEFATVQKWFKNDLVGLDSVLMEPPPPATCEDSFDTASLSSHIEAMRFDGWGAVNAEQGIRMYGCSGTDPLACLTDSPDRTREWGTGRGAIREIRRLDFRTSFWTRSSADGRFVGNGGGSSSRSTITDLATGRDIGVAASYDPGFFPDNSGFIFQGSTGGAGICAQSVLDSGEEVNFDEPQCMTARGINLYQHVARGLSGGDYFVINSQFTSDGGGGSSDPSASFNASSTMKFTPMVFDGTRYQQLRETIVDSPYEGDSVLSPSSRLVGSRLAGPEGRSLGYVIRAVTTQRFGDGYRVDTSREVARVCMPGAKMNFSFDERFFVTHHYEEGTANIYLVDLSDGSRHKITNMPAGTRALFPHFRSDGWFYFLVKSDDGEYVAASDAALALSASR